MLSAQLLVPVLGIFLVLGELLNVGANLANRLDQCHVVRHDRQVVSLVDLTLDLETLLERMHRVLEELALVLVLLLNVGVDVTILSLLVLDEVEETLVDGNLQLLMVIGVLNDLIDSVLEVVDDRIVVTDDVTVRLDGFLDETLADTQVFDHESETSIDLIVLL